MGELEEVTKQRTNHWVEADISVQAHASRPPEQRSAVAIIQPRLTQLRLSPHNRRRLNPSALQALADDIAALVLMQNLVACNENGLL